MPSYLLLPSVLVGAASWEPVAHVLRAGGDAAVVASTAGCSTPEQVLTAYLTAVPRRVDGAVVLVAHSNAGYFAPEVAAAADPCGVVYVDAALPAAAGPSRLAPPPFRDFLAGLADPDGMLPPWTRWWDDIEGLFPDDATRARIERGEPRLPLAYFDQTVRPPAGWTGHPSAYLSFGDTYADEVRRAEALGWPVRRMPGGHLHLLHDPVGCARRIRELAVELHC